MPPPMSVQSAAGRQSFPLFAIVELGVAMLPPPIVPKPWHTPPHWSPGLNPGGIVAAELVALYPR